MKYALKLYNENITYIENFFKYGISNEIIESTNNLIKTLKRVAFGYRKSAHFVSFFY